MERLNEIMSRVAQRRQQESGYRTAHEMPSQGQRARAGAPAPRRALPEQTARLGRPSRPGLQEQQPSLPPRPLNQQRALPNRLTGERSAPQERPARSGSHYSTPAQSEPYHPRTHADVQEGWEDDTAPIRYGDWESDTDDLSANPSSQQGYSPNSSLSYAARRITQTYVKHNRPLVTRQLNTTVEEEPTPASRESWLPVPLPPASITAHQDGRHTHRATQPLNRSLSIDHTTQDTSYSRRSERQIIKQEQSTSIIPSPYISNKTICPICKGAGYLREDVPYGHPNFGKPVACKCKEAERREKRRQQLQNISNLCELQNKTFENFHLENVSQSVQDAYHVALEYAQDPQGWLIFIGRVGCGKTHLAAAIANRILARGSLVLFSTVADLLDHLRISYIPTSTEVYDQVFDKMREAAVLALDDLGAHHSSPWANEKLFQLLNYRYNFGMPTIITTNNIGLQAIDERIRSRMTDASLSFIVNIDRTRDYRPHNPRRE